MKRTMLFLVPLVASACGALVFSGCAMFRANVSESDVNKPVRMSAHYDYEDLHVLGKTMGDAIVTSEVVRTQAAAPIFVILGIENRTTEHIDTQALADTMRTDMLQSGKIQFVNQTRRDDMMREQNFQAANATKDTQVAIGKQLGARYMLTGSLVEIKKTSPREARVSKQEEIFLQLTVELTDLQTGLLVWTKQAERARTIRKPLFGW